MEAPPSASVVIVNWNGRELLDTCLSALARQTFRSLEAVVVDNGSTDGSVALVRERHPEARIVELPTNRGFAAAANEGIRVACGVYVALLNNDVVVDPTWLAELVACLKRHPKAAAATPKLLTHGADRVIDDAGDLLTRYFRAYPRGHGKRDLGQYDEEGEVFAASGAASLWRADVLRALGLFDDDLFFSYEDVDLSFRARLAGSECWYAPGAVASHVGGATSGRRPEFVYFHAIRNRWSMIVKDVPTRLLVRSALRIALAEVLTLLRCAREGELRHAARAYCDIARSLPTWRERRRQVQATRSVSVNAVWRSLERGYPQLLRRVCDSLAARVTDRAVS